MKRKRVNSERKIEHDFFKLKLGTINKCNPLTVYVDGGTFISPLSFKESYEDDINDIKSNFNKLIKNEIATSNYFENKYISDFDIALSGIKPNKKTYLSFQYHLKQNKNNVMNLDMLKDSAQETIRHIMNELGKNIAQHNFVLSKNKK